MNRLRELRIKRKLTVRELGEKTNIAYGTISMMENEVRPFTEQNVRILADFFDVSIDYLLGRDFGNKSKKIRLEKKYLKLKLQNF